MWPEGGVKGGAPVLHPPLSARISHLLWSPWLRADLLQKLLFIVCGACLHETENYRLFSWCLVSKPTLWHQLAVTGIFNKTYLCLKIKMLPQTFLDCNIWKTDRWDLSCKTSAGAKGKYLIRLFAQGGGSNWIFFLARWRLAAVIKTGPQKF